MKTQISLVAFLSICLMFAIGCNVFAAPCIVDVEYTASEQIYESYPENITEQNSELTAAYNDLKYTVTQGEITITGCSSSLTSVSIPDEIDGYAVTGIDYYAFANCSNLESVTIPHSVTNIAVTTFRNCKNLSQITVSDKNKNYSSDKFGILYNKDKTELYLCPQANKLTSYAIPNSVKTISGGAFNNCVNLHNISIPNSVIKIGTAAFYGCKSLENITISESVTFIGSQAFHDTGIYNNSSNWENDILYIGKFLIAVDSGISGDCTIKAGTKYIVGDAFGGCDNLTSVTMPDSLIEIGERAFQYCKNLSSVTIPDNVKNIGDSVFINCYNLKNVEIGNITAISNNMFNMCTSLTSITIPDSVTDIGHSAFSRCENLTSIDIPEGVINIGASAFSACTNLKKVTLSDTVNSIGENAFYHCEKISNIVIPNSVTSIGSHAFYQCSALENIAISNGVIYIGDNAFYDCDNLTNLTIPDSVTDIGESAFLGCDNLSDVIIGEGVTSIGDRAFMQCSNLESITIGGSVKNIGNYAFYAVLSLNTVYYNGTANEWKNIAIGDYNIEISNKEIIFMGPKPKLADSVDFAVLKTSSLALGKSLTIKATASRSDGQKPQSTAVTYEIIEGKDLATIDSKGKLTAIAEGVVVVRATAEFGTEEAYADITINICIPATKVTLNTTKASMIVDGTLKLTATMTPANNTDTITWSVDKEDVATVDENGVVTAHKAGKVKVTSTAGGGKSASCTITIGEPATKVEFTGLKSTSLALGKSITLKAKASCEGKTKPVSTAVVFEIIEGDDIATIDAKGKLTANDLGEVTVRARAEAGTDDAYADVTINICIPATKVTLSTTKASMALGYGELELSATMFPADNTDTITWSVDKEDIATVDENGVVTAYKSGKIKVTAKSGSGKSASCTVTIGEPATRVDVTALKTTSLAVGKSITIKAKAACEGKTKPVSTAVVFEIIEGEDIATIDAKGKLTAKAEGTVVVRVSAEAGTEDAYEDVEIRICNLATKVTLNMTKATLTVGDELQLEATMTAKGECTDTLTWSVDKPNIATVDENGLVTAHSAGKVKVTAKSGSGKSASCTITVTK